MQAFIIVASILTVLDLIAQVRPAPLTSRTDRV